MSRIPLADEKKQVGEEGCVRWVIGDILFLILEGGIQGLLLLYHRGRFTHTHTHTHTHAQRKKL